MKVAQWSPAAVVKSWTVQEPAPVSEIALSTTLRSARTPRQLGPEGSQVAS